jgi:hypothetical protein
MGASLILGSRLARLFGRHAMKIRIDLPCLLRANLQPGDELTVSAITPELRTLLDSARLDGRRFAHIVEDESDEYAVVASSGETTTTGRRRARP